MRSTKSRRETTGRRLSPVQRGREIVIIVNGRPTKAYEGETIHAALLAAGHRQLSKSKSGEPRGVFCGMGVCFECLVTVNKVPAQQACVTMVEAGMEVEFDGG